MLKNACENLKMSPHLSPHLSPQPQKRRFGLKAKKGYEIWLKMGCFKGVKNAAMVNVVGFR
jgi:hypothetical protein